ncbi:hypothetical protein [Ralstonia phage phiRSL1]|uniref:Uncharacterized protein n=1 Tax=Ralstonia phage phiRSL1 TaxID=1980924 RepID=B2ZYF8_9CAUD|nr:hypothetical protein RSL1_ORF310 [Ralstonia phage phiRSL1]BAG41757.1 hypothetical protein [Ralstonia phage phiRSL1]
MLNTMEFDHIVAELSKHLVMGHIAFVNGVNTQHARQLQPMKDGVYGLYFRLQVHAWNGGYERNGQVHHAEWERRYDRVLHVIVTERHNVFVARTDRTRSTELPPLDQWENTTNHDSCWSQNGFGLREVVNEAYETCWAHMPEPHKLPPVMTPIMCQFENWCFGAPPFTAVKVKAVVDPEDSYRKVLLDIKPLTCHLNIIDPEAS